MTDRESGRSRGFRFVTFQNEDSADKVLAAAHSIQGKPVEVKRAEPKKLDRQPRPILVAPMPVPPMYFHAPYGYQYAPNPAIYGHALAYDPGAGYFMAPHGAMYAPQFVPIDDSYDPQQWAHVQYEEAPPVNSRSSRRSVVAGPKRTVLDPESRGERAWSASLVPVEIPSLSLVERVRVAQGRSVPEREVRKKRGMSQPHQRSRLSGVPASAGIPSRKSVVTTGYGRNRRSRNSGVVHAYSAPAPAQSVVASNETSTTTTTTSSTSKEGQGQGGNLHKYFQ